MNINKILLNGDDYQLNETDLPALITYKEKTGGSHFSISLVADLALRGSKILFLTAYPMAKDNFLNQVAELDLRVDYVTEIAQLDNNAQVIIIESGNEALGIEALQQLTDLSERVVLIKNMEVFSQALFDACLGLDKLILSGDIDDCVAKQAISKMEFKTTVIFTNPEIKLSVQAPELEKYVGYLWSKNKEGLTSVDF